MGAWFAQEQKRRDIVLLSWGVILTSFLVMLCGLVLIGLAAGLPNDQFAATHVLQWVFAFSALIFPVYGIVGAWKSWASVLIWWCAYCVIAMLWQLIYFIGVITVAPIANKAAQSPVAFFVFLAHAVALGFAVVMILLLAQYYKNRRDEE